MANTNTNTNGIYFRKQDLQSVLYFMFLTICSWVHINLPGIGSYSYFHYRLI